MTVNQKNKIKCYTAREAQQGNVISLLEMWLSLSLIVGMENKTIVQGDDSRGFHVETGEVAQHSLYFIMLRYN